VKTEHPSIPNTTADPKDLPFGHVSLYDCFKLFVVSTTIPEIYQYVYTDLPGMIAQEENIDY